MERVYGLFRYVILWIIKWLFFGLLGLESVFMIFKIIIWFVFVFVVLFLELCIFLRETKEVR
jgi:hypothetical protein